MIQVLNLKILLYFAQYKLVYCIYNSDMQSTIQYFYHKEDINDKS